MFRPWHIFILAALIVVCPQSRSSATEVDNIWIVSTQTGPTSVSSNLLIVRKGNEYFADHYRYLRGQIQRLVEAITASPVLRLDLMALGVTQKWLDANAEQVLMEWKQSSPGGDWPRSSKNEPLFNDAQFLESFKNLKKVMTLLHNYYQDKWKDDYADLKVVISFQGGEEISVRSKSQHLYMIPWEVEHDGQKYKTFNPQISAALVDLLPGIFATNRTRLSGDLARLIARLLSSPASINN